MSLADTLASLTERMRREIETYLAAAVSDMQIQLQKEIHAFQLARNEMEIVRLNFEKESTSRMSLLRHGMDGMPGAAGPAGPRGERGERGPEGRIGPAGPAIVGPKGDKGEQGPMGSLPIARAWAEGVTLKGHVVAHGGGTYQAVRDTAGIPGSADWVCLAIPGVDGVDGLPGERGEIGIEGKQGEPGAPGERGEMGIEGKQGPAGLPGERGEIGLQGAQGPQGERGEMGIEGKQGPAGLPGERGELGIEGKQGPQGDRGEPGMPGEMGIEGKQGPIGERGEPGTPGERGEIGIEGKQGPAGLPGARGERGERGAAGIVGPRGDRGESIVGPRGEKGEKGERGERGMLPIVKTWKEGVHYKGDVVAHGGGSYQAERDTAQPPGGSDWVPLATPGIDGRDGNDGLDGRSFEHRGTYNPDEQYKALDIVTLNSTWFMATKDSPGPCPGANWRSGPVGVRGKPGDRGPMGPKGLDGKTIEPREIIEFVINERDYTFTPVMSDGTLGPLIQARALFERYDSERE